MKSPFALRMPRGCGYTNTLYPREMLSRVPSKLHLICLRKKIKSQVRAVATQSAFFLSAMPGSKAAPAMVHRRAVTARTCLWNGFRDNKKSS